MRDYCGSASLSRLLSKSTYTPSRLLHAAATRTRLPALPPHAAGSKRLFLARHGETDWNLEERIQGSTCKPLNSTGLAQAQALAELLSETPIELVVTSPLRRAASTAEIIRDKAHAHVKLLEEERFAEMHFGDIEGHRLSEFGSTYRDTLDAWARGELDVRWPGEGGESCQDVADRAMDALQSLSQLPERHLLVVAHSRVNKSLIAALRGDLSRCSDVQQGNTCLNVLDIAEDGKAEVVLLDYREHTAKSTAWS